MPIYVEIAVNVPQVMGIFDYHLPPELEGIIQAGHLVRVPFGKQIVHGVVLHQIDQPSVQETRAVIDLVDSDILLTSAQIALARELAAETLAPLSACIDLMIPPGLAQQAESLYTLQPGSQLKDPEAHPLQQKILRLLGERGPLQSGQLDHAFPKVDWRNAIRGLIKQGLVSSRSVLPPPRVKPKIVRTAQLACPPKQAEEAMALLGRSGSQALERRQTMLRFLIREGGPVDVTWVYAESGGNLQDLYTLAERGLILLGETETWRDPLSSTNLFPSTAPTLTDDQHEVLAVIQELIHQSKAGKTGLPVLLHGVTGAGKTEIYLHAVQATLDLGRQAIILVPEIALTPQSVRRFASRFPGHVGLFHSALSLGERYDTWRRARQGLLSVIVGPRSALFTPLPDLGLIVVDECHDDSYFQADMLPYYHARQAALTYARLTGAVCILGSATPDIQTTYQASQGRFKYLHLPDRILAHRQVIQAQLIQARLTESKFKPLQAEAQTQELPQVQVIDMRQELSKGNRSIFSHQLQEALIQVLRNNQQAILFLNRRGTATYIFCRDCGTSLKCPECDIPLTYHQATSQDTLLCHYCGYQRKLPKKCPICHGSQIRHYGSGTEKVEAELLKLLPQARPLRWDYDTTRRKGAHEMILGHFAAHRADILIGTQMISKGLDLPLVTLVGAVLADVGLNLPDYRASERSFQVLTQVAGRAGRSPLGGQVILQTFQPEHYVIQAAAKHNYRAFYQHELEYRRKLRYPPFSRLVRLEYRHQDAAQAQSAAFGLANRLRQWIIGEQIRSLDMIGPVPCFFSRLEGRYRWQIILRGQDPIGFLRNRSLSEWKIEVNPPNLL